MDGFRNELHMLINEMGFNRIEAEMALQESRGDVNAAIGKLTSGTYAPPPYDPVGIEQTATASSNISEKNRVDEPSKLTFSNLLADLKGSHKAPVVEDKPTAPSFSNLSNDVNQIKLELPETAREMPPPYEVVDKSHKVKAWEKEANVFYFDAPSSRSSSSASPSTGAYGGGFNQFQSQSIYLKQGDRCDACYSLLETTEDVLTQNDKIYHGKCFRKKFGPKCAYCCFPLSLPDKDHDLSGRYLVYKKKDYHVECYEKYAGPRCTYCFNVIIERPNGEFCGSWIVDGSHEYHTECYQKKLHSAWRAQNS